VKIAVLSTPIFKLGPAGGGTLNYSGLEYLAYQHALGLARRGHQVTLVAPDGSYCSGAKMIWVGPEGKVSERQAYNIYWQELLKQDCIIDHTWQKWSVMLKIEGHLKAPTLLWMHAPVDTMLSKLPPDNVSGCCFVCISEDQKSHFEVLFNREARCCRNGVDPDFYRPLNIPRTDRFLFLARFSSIKGPTLALDACKKAEVGLDMVGDTSITNEPELFEYCKREADGEKIKIIGGQPRGACVYWFSQAHAMLHPNKVFREPLGLAPLEAMCCGTPVIGWKYGALKETVNEGVSGKLVKNESELLDAVRYYKANPPTLKERVNCREWAASHFHVNKMVSRVEELCEEAIDTGGWQ
jgi:glycosyltransferase involved in cell wall biosynthesis